MADNKRSVNNYTVVKQSGNCAYAGKPAYDVLEPQSDINNKKDKGKQVGLSCAD